MLFNTYADSDDSESLNETDEIKDENSDEI